MNSPLINLMSAAIVKAAKGLLRDFGEVDQLQISKKGTANFVTQSDIRTEKLLVKELSAVRPSFGFLLEEGGEIKGKDATHRWIIDPLDGTSNFIHAIPYFCISVALEKRASDGTSEILAGVIFDPIHNDLFAAEKGKGATLNGRRLSVSSRGDKLEDAMLVTGGLRTNGSQNSPQPAVMVDRVINCGAILRDFGATALDLANLAAGRIDACWYYIMQPWDIAAGILLVQEAGGKISKPDGSPADTYTSALLASNGHIHLPMQKLLSAA